MEIGIIGVLALTLFFAVIPMSLRRGDRIPLWLPLTIALIHLVSAVAAVMFVQARPFDTDTLTYFYDLTASLSSGVKPGTSFITYLTWWLHSGLGASFDDLMAVYALAGIGAYAMMIRLLADYHLDLRTAWLAALMLLLPSNHFYSSAIGKDGLCMLGVAAVVWGMARFPSRLGTTGFGLLLLVLIRPHIAGVTVLSVGFAQSLSASNRTARMLAIAMLLVAPIAGYFVFREFLDINIFDPGEVSAMLAGREDALASADFTVSYIQNPVLRVASFLLSPLFFDATNALAWLASFENLLLLVVLWVIAHSVVRYRIYADSYGRMLLIYATAMILFLGLTNYNIGLGFRLKTMVFPILFALLVLSIRARSQLTQVNAPQARSSARLPLPAR